MLCAAFICTYNYYLKKQKDIQAKLNLAMSPRQCCESIFVLIGCSLLSITAAFTAVPSEKFFDKGALHHHTDYSPLMDEMIDA